MSNLSYKLQTAAEPAADIASLWVRDEANRLICIIHASPTYGATLEVIDFEHYGDYLGDIVKAAKIVKSAKAADLDAVKAALDNAVKYEYSAEG